MGTKSKPEDVAALTAAGIPVAAYTIPQFCARYSLSRGFYAKLRRLGQGPKETEILGRKFITKKHDAEFARALEARQRRKPTTTGKGDSNIAQAETEPA
jgi:hypothetical protein